LHLVGDLFELYDDIIFILGLCLFVSLGLFIYLFIYLFIFGWFCFWGVYFITDDLLYFIDRNIITLNKGKGHPCTGTEALYRPYGP